MIAVSARALWWCESDGGWPERMLAGEINGWEFLTDRVTLLPVSRLAELPVGYGSALDLRPLTQQAVDGFAEWLTATPRPDPSARLFHPACIEPLEHAGFRIRPLEGVAEAHAICEPDHTVVGLVSPIARRLERSGIPGARVAS